MSGSARAPRSNSNSWWRPRGADEPGRPLPTRLVAGLTGLGYLAGAVAVMSSALVEVGAGLAAHALLAMVALQLLLGYAVGRRWACLLCIAPALLALIPGLLPSAPDVPDYDILFSAMWLVAGLPVSV